MSTTDRLNNLAALQRLVSKIRQDADADFLLVTNNNATGYGAVLFATDPQGLAKAVGSFLNSHGHTAMLAAMQPPVSLIDLDVLATGNNEHPEARPVFIRWQSSYYVTTNIDTDTPESFAFQAMEMLDDVETTAGELRRIGHMSTHFERSLCLTAAAALHPAGETTNAPEPGGEGGGDE